MTTAPKLIREVDRVLTIAEKVSAIARDRNLSSDDLLEFVALRASVKVLRNSLAAEPVENIHSPPDAAVATAFWESTDISFGSVLEANDWVRKRAWDITRSVQPDSAEGEISPDGTPEVTDETAYRCPPEEAAINAALRATDERRGANDHGINAAINRGDLDTLVHAEQPKAEGGDLVTRESALEAIEHVGIHNGPGRESEAIAMLSAAPQPERYLVPAPTKKFNDGNADYKAGRNDGWAEGWNAANTEPEQPARDGVDRIDRGEAPMPGEPCSWDAVDEALLHWYGHKLDFTQSERRRFFDAIQVYMRNQPPQQADGGAVAEVEQFGDSELALTINPIGAMPPVGTKLYAHPPKRNFPSSVSAALSFLIFGEPTKQQCIDVWMETDADGVSLFDHLHKFARKLMNSSQPQPIGAIACYRVHATLGSSDWVDGAPTPYAIEYAAREGQRIEYAYAAPPKSLGVGDEMVERVAEAIYMVMPYDQKTGTKPDWLPRGNSDKQHECRRRALAALGGEK